MNLFLRDAVHSRLAPRASRLTPRASRLTPHASRLTPHASRLTPHASRSLAPDHPLLLEELRPAAAFDLHKGLIRTAFEARAALRTRQQRPALRTQRQRGRLSNNLTAPRFRFTHHDHLHTLLAFARTLSARGHPVYAHVVDARLAIDMF